MSERVSSNSCWLPPQILATLWRRKHKLLILLLCYLFLIGVRQLESNPVRLEFSLLYLQYGLIDVYFIYCTG